MSFYLKPPTGCISLQRLESIAIKRLTFLLNVQKAGDNQLRLLDIVKSEEWITSSECLIGGSQKDNVSHFILRLLLGTDLEAGQFLLEAETRLFAFRFSCMTESEIHLLLKSVKTQTPTTHLLKPNSFDEFNLKHLITVILSIKQFSGSWKTVARKYIQGCHDHFLLPFQAATTLVSKREVTLVRGMARVPFSKVGDILTELFRKLLSIGLRQDGGLLQSEILQDERMNILDKLLKAIFRSYMSSSSVATAWLLHAEDVDRELHHFPPCMTHLHQVLTDKHRLRHHDRIQYTLFLKEAGMSLHQALLFWRKEYSKETLPETGFSHSWQKDEKRYVYNIRHLYGLEGSQRNYRSHCCASLQKRQLSGGEVGGCPFVNFDDCHLKSFMSGRHIPESSQNSILKAKSQGSASECCKIYLQCVVDSLNPARSDEDVVVKNPRKRSHVCSCESVADQISCCSTTDRCVEDVIHSLKKSRNRSKFHSCPSVTNQNRCGSSTARSAEDIIHSLKKSRNRSKFHSCPSVTNQNRCGSSTARSAEDVIHSLKKSRNRSKFHSCPSVTNQNRCGSSTARSAEDVIHSMKKSTSRSKFHSCPSVPNKNRCSTTAKSAEDVVHCLTNPSNQSECRSCPSIVIKKCDFLTGKSVEDVIHPLTKPRNRSNLCSCPSIAIQNRCGSLTGKFVKDVIHPLTKPRNGSNLCNCPSVANQRCGSSVTITEEDATQCVMQPRIQSHIHCCGCTTNRSELMIKRRKQLNICSCPSVTNQSRSGSPVVHTNNVVTRSIVKSHKQSYICSCESVKHQSRSDIASDRTEVDDAHFIIKPRNLSKTCSCGFVANESICDYSARVACPQFDKNMSVLVNAHSSLPLSRDPFHHPLQETTKPSISCTHPQESDQTNLYERKYDGNELGKDVRGNSQSCMSTNKRSLVDAEGENIKNPSTNINKKTCTRHLQEVENGFNKCVLSHGHSSSVLNNDCKGTHKGCSVDSQQEMIKQTFCSCSIKIAEHHYVSNVNKETCNSIHPNCGENKCKTSVLLEDSSTAENCSIETKPHKDMLLATRIFMPDNDTNCIESWRPEACSSISRSKSDDNKCYESLLPGFCSSISDGSSRCNKSVLPAVRSSCYVDDTKCSSSISSMSGGCSRCNELMVSHPYMIDDNRLDDSVSIENKSSDSVSLAVHSCDSGDTRSNKSLLLADNGSVTIENKSNDLMTLEHLSCQSDNGRSNKSMLLPAHDFIANKNKSKDSILLETCSCESDDGRCNESVLLAAHGAISNDDNKSNATVALSSCSSMPDECHDSCFEHDLCPSQIASNLQTKSTEKPQVCTENFNIYKPLDYYASFRRLSQGLASQMNCKITE